MRMERTDGGGEMKGRRGGRTEERRRHGELATMAREALLKEEAAPGQSVGESCPGTSPAWMAARPAVGVISRRLLKPRRRNKG